jgi:tetratricopeptide (TPR) repeat protein
MTSEISSPPVIGDGDIATANNLLEADPAAALSFAESRLRQAPDARLFRIAARACRALGLVEDAEDAELAAIQAGFKAPDLIEAATANRDGRSDESRALIDRFLDSNPDDLLALTMAAEADIHSWELERAEARLREVLDRAPSFLRAIMLLAKYLALQARLREAIAVVGDVVRRKPGNVTALQYLAELNAEANDHEAAAEIYSRLLKLNPAQLAIWIIYAQQLRMLGSKANSQAAFRQALKLDPNNGPAWWGLAYYFTSSMTEQDVAAIEQALAVREGTAEDGGPLHIALSIFAERRGDHEQAFRHVATGKALRAMAHPYDAAAASRSVDELVEAFAADRLARPNPDGCADNAPIFIIGMPRSGTTLLERILSRHSEVEAGGELPIMPRLHESLRRGSDSRYLERLATMSGTEFGALGATYIERSRDYRTSDKPRFIDKLNSNWRHAGLIRLMLPQAKIIDLRRDALDCCWSNFKMLFAEGHIASNDQSDIAHYYRDYVRLTDSLSASGSGILRVRYEDLVDDVEGQTRAILEFLGLDFEPDCLDFHLSTSAVATPSSEQVRRPINREGIGSADPYRQWLGPMIKTLGELAS